MKKYYKEGMENVEISRIIVPDEKDEILKALQEATGADFILTTGGTGLSQRDVTPEICEKYCDNSLTGISEMLKSES